MRREPCLHDAHAPWYSFDMSYFAYILRCADNTYYCGYTDDLEKRLSAHNAGRGAKYTRSRRPVSVVYSEEFDNKHDAMSREYHLKLLTHSGKEALIAEKSACC